jgi:nicotinate-nucleotide adenylyltransferase
MNAKGPRVGVMGGTFDPIHHGHLVAASEAADAFELDEVIFVPTGEPWHKKVVSSSEHRYLMTVIATAANPRFEVSRVDIDRPGTTYTVDTLKEIKRLKPEAELFSSREQTRLLKFLHGSKSMRSGTSLTSLR